MIEIDVSLPAQFADLQRFAESWGRVSDTAERYLLRQRSTMDDMRAFHAAAAHRLDEIFNYLDSFPEGDLPPAEDLLFRTILGLGEVMQAVEIFGEPCIKNAPVPHHLAMAIIDDSPR